MEHKLVEFSKAKLLKKEKKVNLKFQYHDKVHPSQQSGMICSGHQVVAFVPLYEKDLEHIKKISQALRQNNGQCLFISPKGISVLPGHNLPVKTGFHQESEEEWYYSEKAKAPKIIHIIGGGHVSLALSEVMSFLGFYIKIYDDRSDINTLQQNDFCHEKHIVSYESIGSHLMDCQNDYVVIMTFGYRPDKIVLRQLLDKKFLYIGMMGSQSKIKTLLSELRDEGFSSESYEHVFTPIGMDIFSKTPREIAISIAAEIIREANKPSV